ncbi:MAG TPA: hypothetical protein PKM27_12500 [Saprospiraceae bacterium]|nr:hypothetical protein [Saprospiraceae bacterium]HNT19993.1 hypothetical protein [Saprospiraceae bacterium]
MTKITCMPPALQFSLANCKAMLWSILFTEFLIFSTACRKAKGPPPAYETVSLEGSDQKKVFKRDSLGNLLVEGVIFQGKRNGSWVTYHPSGQVETITNYLEDRKNGLYLRFGQNNQIEEQASYMDDLLEGTFIRYQFGHLDERIEYKAGKKNGRAIKYYLRGGMQREMEFKDDVQDGFYRFYGEDGTKQIEEVYRAGKKVSGGIILSK